ncbi:hypothetical protein [Clostridium beijerinckii]|nr:hypothetical protein [Clostridium beijerinckii]NSB81003.1 hypothetical protein [Clostridium beijerinckii]NYC41895.1 hypothetical protein [Clostridium beijerinckii]
MKWYFLLDKDLIIDNIVTDEKVRTILKVSINPNVNKHAIYVNL